jgi:GT2 family glycosyltransferase
MRDQSPSLGIVAIGRNEGERLRACLSSLPISSVPVVYVDSGSSDGSVELAPGMGVDVVALDMSIPFSAARARNEGFSRLLTIDPELEYVQFLDGDCILDDQWLTKGVEFLGAHPEFAIVCGRRRERFPEASIYNRLIDMEWNTPVGEAHSCGGDSLVRVEAFNEIGGFNPTVVAGEEPEMCTRLRKSDWRIMRLDAEMTLHDSAMHTFRQWWKRSLRSGYGGLAVYQRCNNTSPRPFARLIRSSRIWAIGFPLLLFVSILIGYAVQGAVGAGLAFLLSACLLPLQICRVAWKRWKLGRPILDSFQYALLITIAKVPELLGQIRLLQEQRRGVAATLIEHKN